MYAVHIKRHYYASTLNAPKSGYLRDDDGNVETFATRDAAANYAQLLTPGQNYRLQHGEYSPPVLSVRKYSKK